MPSSCIVGFSGNMPSSCPVTGSMPSSCLKENSVQVHILACPQVDSYHSPTQLNKSVEQRLNLSGSQQQGYSATYSTLFQFKSSAKDLPPYKISIIYAVAFTRSFHPAKNPPPSMVQRQKPYSYTSLNARDKIIVSSTDSNLEAFSCNPTRGSFTPLSPQTGVNTNYVNERFLSY